MSKKPSLYLVDGSSYIFRAFFAIRQTLTNSKGMPTNALYGFVSMLTKMIREESPDYMAVVFDTKEKTFRNDLYPLYKANRDEAPEDLVPQFPWFRPLVEAFNITCLSKVGYEADDVIGALARRGDENGFRVVIVSGDKDMMQLVSPEISMLDTMKMKRFQKEDVIDKFGVPPEQVVEVMGLMGDSSDNIPGVAGVGPKTAAELIQKFGSIESLYDRIDEVEKKKLSEKLLRDKDQAFLSRKLATIDTEVSLDCELEDLRVREKDVDKLKELFEEFEFTSLLAGLDDMPSAAPPSPKVEKHYETILTDEAFEKLLSDLNAAGEFALDLETTSKRPVRARMVGISFSWSEHRACYIPVAHRYLGVPDQLDKQMVLDRLKPLLENPSLKKYGHNIKYDLLVLRNEGVELKGIAFDSMLAEYVLDPSKRGLSLDGLAMEYFGRQTIKYKDVAGSASKEIGFDEVEIEIASEYAAEDSDITWLLTQKLRPLLKGQTLTLYDKMELPLIDVLADIEGAGVGLDKQHLADLSKNLEKDLRRFEGEIFKLAGEEFNIKSPKQLAAILFEKLGLPVIKKTKTGASTDMSVMEELASQHELPDKIVSYRQVGKLKSTYVDALPREINPETGRVHTSFNQTIAATGRLSSANPNLQNIPIRGELGREIRKAFVAEGNNILLSADYSQIELRILAHLSGDETLIDAFIKGEDIHARTAAEIFNVPLDKVDDDSRRKAKSVNFGIVYGLSAFGLSRQLKIPQREAKDFIDRYFGLYKNIKSFMDELLEEVRERGYTSTLMNRRRYIPDVNSKNRQARAAAERVAINSPIQGSAADLIKDAMIKISNKLKKEKLKSRMILQVHDELLFECPPEEKSQIEALAVGEMEGVFKLKVPLVVDTGWGKNWNEAH